MTARATGVRLQTPRLDLIACTPELAQLSLDRDPHLGTALTAVVSEEWPPQDLVPALLVEAHSARAPWGIYFVIARDTSELIGSAGFKGPPREAADVEIGYGLLELARGNGYATEAVAALVKWALGRADVARVIAECAIDNVASQKVLSKNDFWTFARIDGMNWWERRK